jgi:hypothetical protein
MLPAVNVVGAGQVGNVVNPADLKDHALESPGPQIALTKKLYCVPTLLAGRLSVYGFAFATTLVPVPSV